MTGRLRECWKLLEVRGGRGRERPADGTPCSRNELCVFIAANRVMCARQTHISTVPEHFEKHFHVQTPLKIACVFLVRTISDIKELWKHASPEKSGHLSCVHTHTRSPDPSLTWKRTILLLVSHYRFRHSRKGASSLRGRIAVSWPLEYGAVSNLLPSKISFKTFLLI